MPAAIVDFRTVEDGDGRDRAVGCEHVGTFEWRNESLITLHDTEYGAAVELRYKQA